MGDWAKELRTQIVSKSSPHPTPQELILFKIKGIRDYSVSKFQTQLLDL